VKRNRFRIRRVVRVKDGKPCIDLKVNWYGCHIVQEKIILFQNLFLCCDTEEMNHAFWKEHAVAMIITNFCSHSGKEFCEELSVLWRPFDAKHFSGDLRQFATVGDLHAVHFEVGEDWDVIIPV